LKNQNKEDKTIQESNLNSLTMHNRIIFLVSIFVLALIKTSNAQDSNDKPGVAEGEKIGNIVKSAVTTAFPVVEKFVDLVWPKGKDKIKKDELETNVKEVRQKLLADAQGKIQPIEKIVNELATINKFLSPSVKANDNLIKMLTRQVSNESYWEDQATDWKIVKAQLQKLSSVKEDEITKIRSKWLNNKLNDIIESNSDIVIRIDDGISKKKNDLPKLLEQLNITVGGITSVVGFIIADLQSDLLDLGQWSKGAAGVTKSNISEEGKDFEDRLTKMSLGK
jgi:hypothetical protein